MEFMKDRIDDILQVAAMNTSIETMHRMYALMGEVIDNTVDMDHLTHDMSDITATLRSSRGFQFLPAYSQLLLLGKTLFRRSALLVDKIDIRYV